MAQKQSVIYKIVLQRLHIGQIPRKRESPFAFVFLNIGPTEHIISCSSDPPTPFLSLFSLHPAASPPLLSIFLKWHEGCDGCSPRSSRLRPHRWGEIKVLCELLTVLPFWKGSGGGGEGGGGGEPPAAVTSPPYHISCITCSSASSPKRQISSVISERISI